jgi:hypothetical protein
MMGIAVGMKVADQEICAARQLLAIHPCFSTGCPDCALLRWLPDFPGFTSTPLFSF